MEEAASASNPLSPPPLDFPLRTRVRFEMAPGVPVPSGIGSLPGRLECRALMAFAAGARDRAGTASGTGKQQRGDEEAAAAAGRQTAEEEEEEEEIAMEKWRKATLYWAHPATPLPQEALAAQKTAQARVAKNPAHATRAQDSGARPGGSAASG